MWTRIRRLLLPNSLQGRLLVIYLALVLLALGGLVGWAGYQLQSSTLNQAKRDLEVDALRLAAGLTDPLKDLPMDSEEARGLLDQLLASYARSVDGSVVVLDSDLQLVALSEYEDEEDDDDRADHDEDSREEEEHEEGERSQIVPTGFGSLLEGLAPGDLPVSSGTSDGRLFAAAPLTSPGGERRGSLLVSIPRERANATIGRNWAVLLMAGGVILFITAAATVLVARQVSGPVKKVSSVSEAIAAGDLERRVVPEGPEEVKRLGRAFNEMADKVEETLSRQRAFVAHAAHELRSPLTSLRLRVEMLQEHGEADPGLRVRYVAQIDQEIDRLQSLTEHLLALSRMESAEVLQMAPVDVAPLLRELAHEMEPLFVSAGLELIVDVSTGLPPIAGDSEAIRMAARNLLDNAMQYTPAGGRVSLAALVEDDEVHITVSDTGQGISPEHLGLVFDRFYRVDKARSRRKGGSGLGLSLVRAIAQAHGGRVGVESAVGKGSTFSVILPGTDDRPSSREAKTGGT